MKNSFLGRWFSGSEIQVTCWTLIHSLWIGLIIALLCGIVIGATRKSAATIRYRLLCGLLMLFVCAIGVTFYLETGPPPPPPSVAPAMVVNFKPEVVVSQAPVRHNQTLLSGLQAFLNQNTSIIFIIWLLFFMLKSLKMVSGLLYIQRIRNYKTHAVTEELKHRMEHLSRQMGIRRSVRLVQSELIKVPVAVGWLKPIILLPLGIAFQLTPEQLDCVLWHELEHIRRRDYLVNILQELVETVFFFNPGLLWLSSLIRAEREACCDDMVLSRMDRKANYLETLLYFGYGEFKQTSFGMGLGSGNQLRQRLKRMISQENKRLGVIEKVVLVSGIVVLSAFAGLTKTNNQYIQQAINGPNEKIDSLVQLKSMSSKKGDYSDVIVTDINATDIHGKKYHLKFIDDKLTEMDINDREIRESELPGYQNMANIFRERDKASHTLVVKKLNAGSFVIRGATGKADTSAHFSNIRYQTGLFERDNYSVSCVDSIHKKYEFTVRGSRLVALTINGSDIQKSDFRMYAYLLKLIPPPPPPPMQPTVLIPPPGASAGNADTLNIVHTSTYSDRKAGGDTTIIYKVTAQDNHGKTYRYVAADYKLLSMSINGKKINNGELLKYEYVVRAVREKERTSVKVSMEVSQKQLEQSRKILQQARGQNHFSVKEEQNGPQEPQPPQKPQPPPSLDKMVLGVINDLISEGVLKDQNSLQTFKLTVTQLVVNGVKQSDNIRKRLSNKYFNTPSAAYEPNYGLYYNARKHGVALGTFDLDLDSL